MEQPDRTKNHSRLCPDASGHHSLQPGGMSKIWLLMAVLCAALQHTTLVTREHFHDMLWLHLPFNSTARLPSAVTETYRAATVSMSDIQSIYRKLRGKVSNHGLSALFRSSRKLERGSSYETLVGQGSFFPHTKISDGLRAPLVLADGPGIDRAQACDARSVVTSRTALSNLRIFNRYHQASWASFGG